MMNSESRACSPTQHAALREVELMRGACLAEDGGWHVLCAVLICGAHSVALPAWLHEANARRVGRVRRAECRTLDEAYGAYWPPRTRLEIERRDIEFRSKVYTCTWRLAMTPPWPAIKRPLFAEVARQLDCGLSAKKVETLYYESVRRDRQQNIAQLRKCLGPAAPLSSAPGQMIERRGPQSPAEGAQDRDETLAT
jgi:hypothetical protein